mgnify:CR=1 FL=1
MASKSEYDTFDYLKPADYLPSLGQRYAEQNQGFEDAEQVAKMNDRQRVANAEIMGRVINNAEKFSKTAATAFKQQRDKAQKAYKNEAFMLQQKLGASFEDRAKWVTEREALGEDTSLLAYYAAKAEENRNVDFANELDNITGWKAQIHEETLAKRWVNEYDTHLWDPETGMLSKDENGQHRFKLTLAGDDGGPDKTVTWETATIAEKYQLIEHYNVQKGFDDISHFRKEFATDVFWDGYQQKIDGIIQGEIQKGLDLRKQERRETFKLQLGVNGEYANGQFAKAIHEYEKNALAYYKGDTSALRNDVVSIVQEMIADGDLDPNEATLENYLFHHTGNNRPENLTVFKEYEDWGTIINDARAKKQQKKEAAIKGWDLGYVDTLKTKLEEENRLINEGTLVEIKGQYDQAYLAEFGELPTKYPEGLTNLMTVEDRDDKDINQILEGKKVRGEKIEYDDYSQIFDDKLRKKWADYAKSSAGQGLTDEALNHSKKMVPSYVQDKLGTTYGYHDYKDPVHNRILLRATAAWPTIYNELADEFDVTRASERTKLHNAVDKELNIRIERWIAEPPPVVTPGTFKQEVNRGLEFIKTSAKNGDTLVESLSSGILKGSEKHYKRLEAYAANPNGSKIPYYYTLIAESTSLNKWDIANIQYQINNPGKELPKPSYIQRSESKPPIVNYMNFKYPSQQKAKRAKIIETGVDVNDESLITPGLVVPIGAVG